MNRPIRYSLIAAYLLVCAGLAHAGSASLTLSFARPTAYTNGNPLPLSDILQYNILCQYKAPTAAATVPCANLAPAFLSGADQGGAISISLPTAGGDVCVQINAQTIDGGVSDWSNKGCKTFSASKANAPTNLTVIVSVAVQ